MQPHACIPHTRAASRAYCSTIAWLLQLDSNQVVCSYVRLVQLEGAGLQQQRVRSYSHIRATHTCEHHGEHACSTCTQHLQIHAAQHVQVYSQSVQATNCRVRTALLACVAASPKLGATRLVLAAIDMVCCCLLVSIQQHTEEVRLEQLHKHDKRDATRAHHGRDVAWQQAQSWEQPAWYLLPVKGCAVACLPGRPQHSRSLRTRRRRTRVHDSVRHTVVTRATPPSSTHVWRTHAACLVA